MRLIGLTGYAGSGKDTLCAAMLNLHPYAVRYAFADALKEEVATAFGTTVEFIEENKLIFRELLQSWGVTRRSYGPDYWVEQVAKSISEDAPKVAIVTDVRFLNEATWIKQSGGSLVRVVRPGNGAVNGHISEHELSNYAVDCEVINDGTLEDLVEKAYDLLMRGEIE